MLTNFGLSQNLFKTDKNDLTYAFVEALKNKEFGDFRQAIYILKKCAKIDTTCGACFFEIAKIYEKADDKLNALKYAIKAVEIDTINYWYLRFLAQLQIKNELYYEAECTYKKLVEYGSIKNDDWYNYSLVLFKSKKNGEALNILNKIEYQNGVSEVVSIEKYKYYLNIKKYKIAENEILKLIKYFPDNYNYYGILAETYAIENKRKEALKYYFFILNNDSFNIKALTSLARFYLNTNDTDNARITYNKVFLDTKIEKTIKLQSLKDCIINSYDQFMIYRYLPGIIKYYYSIDSTNYFLLEIYCDYYEKIKNYKDAIKTCFSIVRTKDNNQIYWQRIFYYYDILQEYSKICYYADSIIKIYPENQFINLIAGIANYQMNNKIKALDYLKRGYNNMSNNNFINNQCILYLAETYYKLGKRDSAYFYFDLGIRNMNNLIMMNNYAYYLSENSDSLEKAKHLSLITLKSEPENCTFLDTYAWILYKCKSYKLALKFIKSAYLKCGRNNGDIIEHYGDILYCNNKKDKAIKYWRKALEFKEDNDKLKFKLSNFKCE